MCNRCNSPKSLYDHYNHHTHIWREPCMLLMSFSLVSHSGRERYSLSSQAHHSILYHITLFTGLSGREEDSHSLHMHNLTVSCHSTHKPLNETLEGERLLPSHMHNFLSLILLKGLPCGEGDSLSSQVHNSITLHYSK